MPITAATADRQVGDSIHTQPLMEDFEASVDGVCAQTQPTMPPIVLIS